MESPASLSPLTVRAALLGLVGAVAISALQVASRVLRLPVVQLQSVLTLFAGPVFFLFLLALVNVPLKRRWPRHAFRPGELALIYGITTVAASIAAYDEAQYLLPVYVYPHRASQADSMGAFRSLLPAWLAPQDPAVVEPYYLGHVASLWDERIWRAWLVPLGCWMAWLVALGATFWGWNVLLRRRWVEGDRLSFPCVQLPLELCRSAGFGGNLVGGRGFWLGFAVSALIESLSQVHARYPNVPALVLDWQATPTLEALPSPWKALAPMYLTWSTVHLGVCYLIPTDILFSGWFFYVLRKACEVWGYAMGWRELGWDAQGFPYTRAQSAGSWAALCFLLLWAERRHLSRTFLAALGLGPPPRDDEDRDEAARYVWAARLLLGGTAFLVWWSVQSGMSLRLALAYYAFFWILNIVMTRVFAQVGPSFLELYYLDPQKALTTVFGTLGESPGSLAQFSLMYWINRDHRGQLMGHQLAALKIAQASGLRLRTMGGWILVAFALGAAVCLIAHLHFAYRIGEDQFATGGWRESGAPTSVSRLREWVYAPKGPQWTEIGFMGLGGALTWLLAKINFAYPGTSFHPIGYALAVCFAVEYNWPAFFLMWLAKTLLIRFGGLPRYLAFVPAALGLTLGGIVVPVLWSLIAYLFEWYA